MKGCQVEGWAWWGHLQRVHPDEESRNWAALEGVMGGAVGTGEQERGGPMRHLRQAVLAWLCGGRWWGRVCPKTRNHSFLKLDLHERFSGKRPMARQHEHCQPPSWSQLLDNRVEQWPQGTLLVSPSPVQAGHSDLTLALWTARVPHSSKAIPQE